MALKYDSEFIFIGKGDESFLENYSYELSEDPDGSGGRIFMALEILNNQAEAEDLGEAIFANFKQKFYEDLNTDAFDRFEAALKAANSVIETLKEEKVSRFIGNLNIAIGAVTDGNLYISTTGDAEVYLIRKRFVSIVSEGLAGESNNETFVNIANGTFEGADRVVFSSSRLLRYITKAELGKIFSDPVASRNIGDALTNLQDFLMTEMLGRSAVIGLAVSQAEEKAGSVFEEEIGGSQSWLSALFARIPKPKFLEGFSLAEKLPGFAKIGERLKILAKGLLARKELIESKPKIHFSEKMTKERMLILIITLLVVLVGGIFWIRTRGNQKRQIAEQQAKLNYARELINDASTVGQFDKPKASDLLAVSEKEAMEVLNSRFLRAEAVKILDDIQKFKDNLDDVKRISEPNVLVDFSEKRSTVSALGLLALKDRLYGFEYNALYEIVLDKLQDILTISDIETIILGADFADQNSLLFLTRTGKMIEYKDARFALINTKDGIWKKGIDMKSYSDRVYILDPERNQIWRYPRLRDSFDAATTYNQNADLKSGVAFAIDSSVYVLNSDGTITYLYQGQKQEYPLRRPPLNAVIAPTRIYTNADLSYLFVLEPSKQRILLFRKDLKNGGAQYQTQYIFEKTGVLRDLMIADNRLYVMDDKKVYFVNLGGL